jgi:hypothetical protein
MGCEDLLTGIGCDRTHCHKTKPACGFVLASHGMPCFLRFGPIESPAAPECLSHPFQRPQRSGGSFFCSGCAPQSEKARV